MNRRMRKLLPLTLMFIAVLPALAKDDETKIKAVVEDRYKEWIAAASKKDTEALTALYDENAILMPTQEEPVIGSSRTCAANEMQRLAPPGPVVGEPRPECAIEAPELRSLRSVAEQ